MLAAQQLPGQWGVLVFLMLRPFLWQENNFTEEGFILAQSLRMDTVRHGKEGITGV